MLRNGGCNAEGSGSHVDLSQGGQCNDAVIDTFIICFTFRVEIHSHTKYLVDMKHLDDQSLKHHGHLWQIKHVLFPD